MMKPSTLSGAGAPLKPNHAKTVHDALPVPGGRRLGDMANAELVRVLMAAGVPGVSHENGRAANVGAYAEHIARIREAAGNRAVAEFVSGGRGQ